MSKTVHERVFEGAADFQALRAAEAFLKSIGASYGSNERGAPTGILFGSYAISKWRNMTLAERGALHGIIDAGDHRSGPVRVRFYDIAPAEALARLSLEAA